MSAYDEHPHDHFLDDYGGIYDDDGDCCCAYFSENKCRSCREQEEQWEEEMQRLEAEEAAAAAAQTSAAAAGGGAAAGPPPPIRAKTATSKRWSDEVRCLRAHLDRVAAAEDDDERVAFVKDLFETLLLGGYEEFLAQNPRFRDVLHGKIAELRADERAAPLLKIFTQLEEMLEDISQRDDFIP